MSGRFFFPSKVVYVSLGMQPGEPTQARSYRVTKLDVVRRPTDEDLSVALPSGTSVHQRPDGTRYFTCKQDEKIGPNDLKRLWAMTERSRLEPLMDTAVVRGVSFWSMFSFWSMLLWTLGGLSICGGAYVLYVRRSRNA